MSAEIHEISKSFLATHGVPELFTLEPLAGGANNRVFKVSAGGNHWVLKQYFKRSSDPRDRFAADHDYYTCLWDAGIRQIPQPLGWNRKLNLGLFEFLDGRKLEATEIDSAIIGQALNFITDSNVRCLGAELKPASEACFSLAEHFATVDRRIQRLEAITEPAAREFVSAQLTPAWRRIAADQSDRSDPSDLPGKQRCISPSDFGFHNAILQADGTLKFFDFEYAGTDDPAKLVCDFFCQPRLPPSLEHWERFVQQFATQCHWDDTFLSRAKTLLPVYQIKWCCIMLNEFLHSEAQRRQFSGAIDRLEARKNQQLAQAEAALAQIRQD